MRILILLLLPFTLLAQLPSSGSLSIKSAAGAGRSISQQVDGNETGSKSLTTLSTTASKVAPHSMLEFYGYPSGPGLPGSVTSCTATLGSCASGELILSWVNPSTGGTPEGTEIYVSVNSGAYTLLTTVNYPGTTYDHTSGSPIGIVQGNTYSYQFNATNSAGDGTTCGPSSTLTYPFNVNIPTGVTATNNYPSGVNVSWSHPSGGATPVNYEVRIVPTGTTLGNVESAALELDVITYPGTSTVISHSALADGNTYDVYVKACNSSSSFQTAAVSVNYYSCSGPPNTPTAASASVVSDDASVNWTLDSFGQTASLGVRVERNAQSDPGTWTVVANNLTGTTSYVDNNLPSDQYIYRVSAQNYCGNSTSLQTNTVIVP